MKDLWVPVSGAIAQQRKVETIANNLANANTPGFKKDEVSFKEHLTVLEHGYSDIDIPNKDWKPSDFYHSYGSENAKVEVDGSYTIHEQGQLAATGNKLDFAINGQGFFELLTPYGIRYTRNGSFNLSPDGYLINNQGYHVLSNKPVENPKDRLIQISTPNIGVNAQGEIFDKGLKTNQLSIASFKDVHALKKQGQGLFVNKDEANKIDKFNEKILVKQGFIEQSNVNAIREMSKLIQAHRQFESIQNVIKAYDNISSKAVNEISRF